MASVSISCPSCSATDGVVRNGKAMNGVGCRATARIMGAGLNTILRHLKNSGRSRSGPLGKRKLSYVKRFKLTGDFVPLSANP